MSGLPFEECRKFCPVVVPDRECRIFLAFDMDFHVVLQGFHIEDFSGFDAYKAVS